MTRCPSGRILGAALAAALLLHVLPWATGSELAGVRPAAAERAAAPDFRVRDFAGKEITLRSLTRRGPVLLDFWATWCKPCLSACPELAQLHEKYSPAGLQMLGISVDGPRNFSKVRLFAAKLRIPYRVVLDEDGTLQQKFRVGAVPTTVLIDTSGAVVRITQGYRPGEGAPLEKAIRGLLGLAEMDSAGARPDGAESGR